MLTNHTDFMSSYFSHSGVNMPARTTVISTVTKKIKSEVITLKTSQLLQMAGRAGRRGKDTEGSVVLMKNSHEDISVGEF